MTLAATIVAYDRDNEAHRAFVFDSFVQGSRHDRNYLHAEMRRPGVRCLLAVVRNHPGEFLGWAAADGDTLLWAHTKEIKREAGVFRLLLQAMGLDGAGVLPCRFWSPHAQALALAGKVPLVYAPFERGAIA